MLRWCARQSARGSISTSPCMAATARSSSSNASPCCGIRSLAFEIAYVIRPLNELGASVRGMFRQYLPGTDASIK